VQVRVDNAGEHGEAARVGLFGRTAGRREFITYCRDRAILDRDVRDANTVVKNDASATNDSIPGHQLPR